MPIKGLARTLWVYVHLREKHPLQQLHSKNGGGPIFKGGPIFGRLQQLLNYSSKDTAITQPIMYHGKKTTAHVNIKRSGCPVVLWSEERGGSCVSM